MSGGNAASMVHDVSLERQSHVVNRDRRIPSRKENGGVVADGAPWEGCLSSKWMTQYGNCDEEGLG